MQTPPSPRRKRPSWPPSHSRTPHPEPFSHWRWMHLTLTLVESYSSCRPLLAAVGIFFKKTLTNTGQILHIRLRALGGIFGGPPLPLPLGGSPFSPPDGPQTSCGSHVQSFAAVVRQAAAPDGLPGRIHRRFPSYSRGDKCRCQRSFAAIGPLHGSPCAAGNFQPNPATQRRREGPRRRAAFRDGKNAAEAAAQLRRFCNSGIESTRDSDTLSSSGAARSGPLPGRRRCAAVGFFRNRGSTDLLPRCGLNASLHGSLHCLKTDG
jgi:hypothetical protein